MYGLILFPPLSFTEYVIVEVEFFFIMNFLNFLRKTTVSDSNDSNKTGMGFALSRDLFYFGFFVAAAEFRLGFGRC